MIELHLDTTVAKQAKVTITRAGKIVITNEGAEPLPTIHQALEKARLDLKEIDKFTANPGPGSYTGIRIGLAIINALNWSLGKSKEILEAKYQ